MLDLQHEKELLYTKFLTEGKIQDKRVLKAFLAISREQFIPPSHRLFAYDDAPLPIGKDQTISQPTTVLLMTQWLEVEEGQQILEIGTGSGYQAAILSYLVGKKGKVFTIETIKELYSQAKKNLQSYTNIEVIYADGSEGYPKKAPYDRIILAAAAPTLPTHLLAQVKKDGILLAPVGEGEQAMIRIRKDYQPENLGAFVFVPLTGKYGKK